jgi:Predicted sugar kinase
MLNISVFPNPSKDNELQFTKKLLEYLFQHCCTVFMSERSFSEITAEHVFKESLIERKKFKVVPEDQIYSLTDLGIVLGGDGTILRIGKKAAENGLLILGVNLGKIGYIAELESDELNLIEDIFTLENISQLKKLNGFSVDHRMMLKTEIIRNGKIIYTATALNDAVISKGSISKMIDITVICNGREITSYRADGIIISTPTGSTAYSMSAGGPIIDPSIECICTIPVCPYLCVNASPVIFSSDSCLEIVFHTKKSSEAYLTVDGKGGKLLRDNDKVRIKKSPYFTKLLRIKNIDFYKLLNTKLSQQIDQ